MTCHRCGASSRRRLCRPCERAALDACAARRAAAAVPAALRWQTTRGPLVAAAVRKPAGKRTPLEQAALDRWLARGVDQVAERLALLIRCEEPGLADRIM